MSSSGFFCVTARTALWKATETRIRRAINANPGYQESAAISFAHYL